mmetsp:Transcript_82159/g.236077  ORF Transcript_82159/g.236077 Transcript_82159/m.236077 type:complete len:254 (+) Transcript_82159:259-1020(+)
MPTSASSSSFHSGVWPNSVRFANSGTSGRASLNFLNWARSVTASAKMQSAPPSLTYALQRSMAESRPSMARESVRAMMTISWRPRIAACKRDTISPVGTTCLLGRCPQRLADTWSSMWMAPAPACSMSRTVRSMLKIEAPKPVSMSTKAGTVVTRVSLRTSTSTSSSPVTPKSGTPRLASATPPPLTYTAWKPMFCAIRPAYALVAPTIWRGFLVLCASIISLRNFAPADSRALPKARRPSTRPTIMAVAAAA